MSLPSTMPVAVTPHASDISELRSFLTPNRTLTRTEQRLYEQARLDWQRLH